MPWVSVDVLVAWMLIIDKGSNGMWDTRSEQHQREEEDPCSYRIWFNNNDSGSVFVRYLGPILIYFGRIRGLCDQEKAAL
jgi:hypothetical protein